MSYSYGSFVRRNTPVRRPVLLGLLAIAGVLGGLGLFILAFVAAWIQFNRGTLGTEQIIWIVSMAVVGLLLLWINWGMWEFFSSSWWANVILGPVTAICGLLLFGKLATLDKLLALDQLGRLSTWASWGVMALLITAMVLGVITAVYLQGQRQLFGIGVPKPIWERRRMM